MFDLCILSIGQQKPTLSIEGNETIFIEAVNEDPMKKPKCFCDIAPMMNFIEGIWYLLNRCEEETGGSTVCDYQQEEKDYPFWIDSATVKDDLNTLIIIDECQSSFRAIVEHLIEQSAIHTVIVLCHYQSEEQEVMLGTFQTELFFKFLAERKILTNVCYVISDTVSRSGHALKQELAKSEAEGYVMDAQAYYSRGRAYDNNEDEEAALADYRKAIYLDPNCSDAYIGIGFICRGRFKFDEALESFLAALQIEKRLHDDSGLDIAIIYGYLGDTYHMMGDLENTLDCYIEGLEIYKKTLGELDSSTLYAYRRIGRIYCEMGENQSALEYFLVCLKCLEFVTVRQNSSSRIKISLNDTIGLIYRGMGQLDLAVEHYKKSVEAMEQIGDYDNLAFARFYSIIGSVYLEKQENENALVYLKKAAELIGDKRENKEGSFVP